MLGIDKPLLDDEKVLFSTRKHFIIFLSPLIWTVIAFFFLYLPLPSSMAGFNRQPLLNSLANIAWIPVLIALYFWLSQALLYRTSKFIVTNQRLIMREGFFFRQSTETRLSAIAEVKIDQTILGQLLNYGTITINSFGGGGAQFFSWVAEPYELQRQVLTTQHSR